MLIPQAIVQSSGGLSSVWTNSFTETGGSLANWTQDSGSWSVSSGAFHVDTTGGTIARLKYNTAQATTQMTAWLFAADVKMSSIGTNAPLGLLWWWTGSGSGAPAAELFANGGAPFQIRGEVDTTASILTAFTPSPTWASGVFSRLGIFWAGASGQVILDGALVGEMSWTNNATTALSKGFTAAPFVGLVANNCIADFKNIRLDYLALPS